MTVNQGKVSDKLDVFPEPVTSRREMAFGGSSGKGEDVGTREEMIGPPRRSQRGPEREKQLPLKLSLGK